MKCVLALDQSTSATKAVLLDLQGRVLAQTSREHQQFYPRPGWVEHDPEEIWQNLLESTRAVLTEGRSIGAEVALVSIANQRETIVVFERVTGIPLHPAIVWQCRRGDPLCAAQKGQGREAQIRSRSGLRLDSYFPAPKLQWLMHERPDVAAALQRGDALIGTIDTYLIHRLTGGAVFATDHTNASRTLLYDIQKRAWDEELCRWWEVPMRALAPIRPSDAHFGETTLAGQLPAPVPIRGVMGDSHAAMFGQRCMRPGSAKVTFGTGSSILLNTGDTPPQGLRHAVGTLAWVRGNECAYALEGIITSSAATMVWLRDQMGIIDDVARASSVAAELNDDDGVYVVPAFSGLGAPWWRASARGAIVGLSAYSDRRHVVRAGLESIAYQLRDVLEMMRAESGVELREIRADGGPTVNGFLMQFVADIVGIELSVARRADRAAVGAALMGALGAGMAVLPEEFAGGADNIIYRRQMPESRVEARYQGWLRAVNQVLCGASEN
jgi:glycerol kinase